MVLKRERHLRLLPPIANPCCAQTAAAIDAARALSVVRTAVGGATRRAEKIDTLPSLALSRGQLTGGRWRANITTQ